MISCPRFWRASRYIYERDRRSTFNFLPFFFYGCFLLFNACLHLSLPSSSPSRCGRGSISPYRSLQPFGHPKYGTNLTCPSGGRAYRYVPATGFSRHSGCNHVTCAARNGVVLSGFFLGNGPENALHSRSSAWRPRFCSLLRAREKCHK
jgi:hypothetical protein